MAGVVAAATWVAVMQRRRASHASPSPFCGQRPFASMNASAFSKSAGSICDGSAVEVVRHVQVRWAWLTSLG
jgi:hypothetical protein